MNLHALHLNSLISSKPFAYEKDIRSESLPWISETTSAEPSQTTDMFEQAGLLSKTLLLIWPLHGTQLNSSKGPNPKDRKSFISRFPARTSSESSAPSIHFSLPWAWHFLAHFFSSRGEYWLFDKMIAFIQRSSSQLSLIMWYFSAWMRLSTEVLTSASLHRH